MRISYTVTFITSIVSLVQSAAIRKVPLSHVIHEKRELQPSQWVKRDRVEREAILPVRVGLSQSNLEKGYDYLMDVSDPASPDYAMHWTPEQIIEAFSPSDEAVSAVLTWLVSSGIDAERITHTENKAWLAFDATTQEAEDLFHAEYHEFQHTGTGHVTIGCDAYHVPAHIQEHIDYITPGMKLLGAMKKRALVNRTFIKTNATQRPPSIVDVQAVDSSFHPETAISFSCDEYITPACIKALYQVPTGNKHNPNNAMGIFELGDYYAQADLDAYWQSFYPTIPAGTGPKAQLIDGAIAPVAQADAGTESDLDFMMAYPLIYPQSTVLYQADDAIWAQSRGGFNTFLDAIDGSYCTYSAYGDTGDDPNIDPFYPDPSPGGYKGKLQCGIYKPTNVISISYGGQETDLPAAYQFRQCNEFMKLGLQGVTVLFASGDSGVAGPSGCIGSSGKVFSPTWPNNCPYLTNVGATKIMPGQTTSDPESAVNDLIGHPYTYALSSGGGFSNIYSTPNYQKSAVFSYFATHNPPYPFYMGNNINAGGLYNRLGRAYPDVAAVGDNIVMYNKGKLVAAGGTSASTPIFGAIINRINEERLAVGKKAVGFINPTLYAYPGILKDIVSGNNPGCGTNGFSAVPGWDPVTGLGTPNYPKMLSLFLSLP